MKRTFDILCSLLGLLLLAPLLVLVASLIKLGSDGPVFYRSLRAGRRRRPFRIFKFRTMVVDAEKLGPPSTADDDPRITKVGKVLRKYKMDELPQLLNVLKGEMSLVGPRPEVQRYIDMYTEEERAILNIRPGITDWASLWNRDEGAILSGSPDPDKTYLEKIRPQKITLQLKYVRGRSFWIDLKIIIQTLATLILGPSPEPWKFSMRKDTNNTASESYPNELSINLLRQMYATMVRIRVFEERVAVVVESGEVKTPCHLYIGQEAVATGVCAALNNEDYVWGGHRSHGHYLAKCGDLQALMAEIFGKRTGCSRGRGGSMHLFASEVGILGTVPLVAATIPLAVGAGLASKLRGDDRISVSFFGDGATEEGHFHESLNLAALYCLPVIFVCENNLYASHMPLLERRAEDNIAKSGAAHGVPAVSVDGNDVVAVYQAAAEAVQNARSGKGPHLLECRTYRWRGHVGASWDMDVGVKRRDELKDWLSKDPIMLARFRLTELGVRQDDFEQIERATVAEVEDAVDFARQSPSPHESELLEYVFHGGEETP